MECIGRRILADNHGMNTTFSGSTVVITGAAGGIGQALARFFVSAGAVVIVHYWQSESEAHALKQELGEKCFLYQANLTQQEEVSRLFANIYRDHHAIDILINTVGSFIYKPLPEITVAEFATVLATNLQATFACSKAVLPDMMARHTGAILNFGCAGADRMPVTEFTVPYYIAKNGVVALTRALAQSYAPHGISINCISPGIMENSVADVATIPAGRRATYEDIWAAVSYLLSPAASYCNGTNLEVSGGWTP